MASADFERKFTRHVHQVANLHTFSGIETPLPIQPDMVSDCNKFYLVKKGDTCVTIAVEHGITEKDFATWNPKVGGNCAGLWAETYACVSVIGYKPTPTDPGNGISTPLPVQPGLLPNCIKFHLVLSGESCAEMAARYGISVTDVVAWNPNAGRNCEALWANTYACVGMPAFRLQSYYNSGCKGKKYNDVTVARVALDGVCVNTDCQVASLDIAAEGVCPGGQVQISYWENAGCKGKWFGYGYTSRGTCRNLWSQGWKFKALHFRCISSAEDCVNRKTCSYDPEPQNSSC
ncbi:hypothetical protein NQ176_g3831 [Zarea fungicola]|uniref:Uncharacterized protein n=1 Tax=Zarea fungicola TaxID=93591 RepID=A0ACC1NHL6_9HYPO|nr:hypothetical protein NQ176_g3831 [Lecanicillium fungicola]